MKAHRFLAALFTLAFAAAAFAQKPCTAAESAAAAKAIDRVSSWATLHGSWKAYRHCDAGPVADGFTEALLRLVVDWKRVDALANDMKDPAYRDFVIAHLKSPAAESDAEDVYSRAKASCPKGQEAFCAEIAEAVKPAKPQLIQMEPMAPIAPSAPAPATPPKK